MPNPLYAVENGGPDVYQIGIIGRDLYHYDKMDGANIAFTATIRSEDQSPAGEYGEVIFRRVSIRIRRSVQFDLTLKVYVDGVQTQIFDASSQLVDQSITFSYGSPSTTEEETIIEAAISARGTYISVELEVTSTDIGASGIGGTFLPESCLVFFRPLSEAHEGSVAETQ